MGVGGGLCPQDIKGRGPLLLRVVLCDWDPDTCLPTGPGPAAEPAEGGVARALRERSREPEVGACTVISGGTWRDMFHPDSSTSLLSQAQERGHQTRGVTDILA